MQEGEVPARIYGSEIEYAYSGEDIPGVSPKLSVPAASQGAFLPNGARVYVDRKLPEYATPECRDLDELVAHEIAGEQIMAELYCGSGFVRAMYKRCLSPDGNYSVGAHENYSSTVSLDGETNRQKIVINTLASHFATRTVYTGAGFKDRQNYVIGQKIHGISTLSGVDTLNAKTLVNTRLEPHSHTVNRIHNISGDANISPWATKMKFGTTSLVLRLLEMGFNTADIHLHNPVQSAHVVAGQIDNMHKPMKLASGQYVNALDIQERLIQKVLAMAGKVSLPPQELEIIEQWQEAIDALSEFAKGGEARPILGQIDWFAKGRFLQRYQDSKGISDAERLVAADIYYAKLAGGSGFKLREKGMLGPNPSPDSVEHAKHSPPAGRPQRRGAVVVAAYEGKLTNRTKIDWKEVIVDKKKYTLGSVFANYNQEELDDFCRTIGLSAVGKYAD